MRILILAPWVTKEGMQRYPSDSELLCSIFLDETGAQDESHLPTVGFRLQSELLLDQLSQCCGKVKSTRNILCN